MEAAFLFSRSDDGGEFVAEYQGLYGPFSFSEKLLQRIWFRGDFDRSSAVTTAGKRVRILSPGKWNQLGGPDFKDARIELDGVKLFCDVELHLRAEDWAAHRHAADPAYGRVGLHVVLAPPDPGHATRGKDGWEIPVLALLPLLPHGLEEFAAEEAIETLASRPMSWAVEGLGRLTPDELGNLIRGHALARWRQKLHFAELRLRRLGWPTACHHAALEILGYRFNRAPMLRVAGHFPLADWDGGACDPRSVFDLERSSWNLQGVRPANQPHSRLRQYASWTRSRPDWPARLECLLPRWPVGKCVSAVATAEFRKAHRLPDLRDRFVNDVCGAAIGGTRVDNLVCDGMLPLMAVRSGLDFAACWYHWFPGDVPAPVAGAARALGIVGNAANPAAHGIAQGLLGWVIECEGRGDQLDKNCGRTIDLPTQ